ncbi:MAG TPA: GvpL/GvpF family gas vesicle protein, partial [Vicinamibacterales bacterium]|nr:GvpL/GvpF family gas vesicle protein [Vicinamibacterales bacterium]
MTAVYLYCVAKAARKPSTAKAPDGLLGASRPEALHVAGSLWLVAAEVPLETYGPGRLESHLADFDWVGRIALAHEAVVEHFARQAGTTVIPMKLFTMFSTRARAVADIGARKKAIDTSLRKIAGAEEWGIRVLRGEPLAKAPAGAAGRAASGAAFLAAKKQARDAARHATVAAAEVALQAYERLSKLSKDSRRRVDAPSAGAAPLLDAAFLVASAQRTKFTQMARREAAACAAAGARMTLSGPWPAYNFV